MDILNNFKQELKVNKKKTIILTETEDIRILKACSQIEQDSLVKVLLVGNKKEILNNCQLNNITLTSTIIDNSNYKDIDKIITAFYELRKAKGLSLEDAKKLITTDKLYFACMLVKLGLADGLVCGAITSSKDVLKKALQTIHKKAEFPLASSFFVINTNDESLGYKGVFIFSDCAMNINPSASELATIAYQSALSFKTLIKADSKVALLSYSTYSSGSGDSVNKVKEAVTICQNKYKDLAIDGELQLDAAINKEVAKQKAKDSTIAGYANTLIFPDLNSGNIGYKLVERLGNAKAYGPICQGLNQPVSDLSRGCNYQDIIATIYITAIQAIHNR